MLGVLNKKGAGVCAGRSPRRPAGPRVTVTPARRAAHTHFAAHTYFRVISYVRLRSLNNSDCAGPGRGGGNKIHSIANGTADSAPPGGASSSTVRYHRLTYKLGSPRSRIGRPNPVHRASFLPALGRRSSVPSAARSSFPPSTPAPRVAKARSAVARGEASWTCTGR